MSDTYDKKAVGKRLAFLRQSQGFGLRPFARHMDLDHTKLNHWEKGTNYPDISFVAALHRLYGVTADWIYFGEIRHLPLELVKQIQAAERKAASEAAEPAQEEQTTS